VYYKERTNLRLTLERRSTGKQCQVLPRSRSVESLSQEFAERVLTYITLDEDWKTRIMEALVDDGGITGAKAYKVQVERMSKALENLRKQHLWGDISDMDYRKERADLERQINAIAPNSTPVEMPSLERAVQLLKDLPALWQHPGVTNKQRESLVQNVFSKICLDGGTLVAIEPKPAYAPLFADILLQNSVGYCDLKSTLTRDILLRKY
jgi:hypothetical protein